MTDQRLLWFPQVQRLVPVPHAGCRTLMVFKCAGFDFLFLFLPAPQTLSSQAEQPHFFFRAEVWRVGLRREGPWQDFNQIANCVRANS